MNANRLFWGILLITFGILLLLGQLDVITFSVWSLISFWPVVLIIIGISLLKIGEKAKIASAIVISAAVIVISLTLDTRPSFVKFFDEIRFSNIHNYQQSSNGDWDMEDLVKATQRETISFSEIKSGELDIVCAAGEYDIKGDSDYSTDTLNSFLYSFTYPQSFSHDFKSDNVDGIKKVIICPVKADSLPMGERELDLTLNSRIPWKINIKSGASSIDADFTAVNLTDLTLSGGASEVDLKLGNIAPLCKVDIKAGASSIDIKVPKDVGCKIEAKMGMSIMNRNGFNDGVTPLYDQAEKKIIIKVAAGVSKVNIERY